MRDVTPPTVTAVAIGALREVGVDAKHDEDRDIAVVPWDTPESVVLKALALAWIAEGEPLHELVCAGHADIALQPSCRRRTAVETVADPEAHCGA
jgi:hypothetical protein